MTRHPEQFDRGSDGQPYDPDKPLVVRWADVVAAATQRRPCWSS